ncbi:MAG: cell division protein FtsX, partial [Bacteroidota bacterium]
LSREYIWQIALAAFLVIPIAYLVLETWLSNFAYRIVQSWHTYVLGVLVITLIVGLTICWELFKAAYRNPVDSIRNE